MSRRSSFQRAIVNTAAPSRVPIVKMGGGVASRIRKTISIVRDPLVIVDKTTTEIGLGRRQGGVES